MVNLLLEDTDFVMQSPDTFSGERTSRLFFSRYVPGCKLSELKHVKMRNLIYFNLKNNILKEKC